MVTSICVLGMCSFYNGDLFICMSGLCGFYNGNPLDDLMFPNGTLYTGEGDQEKGQPRPFNQAWRYAQNTSKDLSNFLCLICDKTGNILWEFILSPTF